MKNQLGMLAMSVAIFASSSLQNVFAQAEKIGNGGNAVVCFNDPKIAAELVRTDKKVSKTIPSQYTDWKSTYIKSIQTLDLYNASKPMGLLPVPAKLIEPSENETAEGFALRLSKRISPSFMHVRVQAEDYRALPHTTLRGLYALGEKTFHKNIEVSKKNGIFPSDDVDPLTLAEDGCVYTTMAIQRSVGAGRRELKIDGRLFNHPKHSLQSQGVLYLHEAFLAAVLELEDKEFLQKTEGVQELVATLLKTNVNFGEVLEVINGRKLFCNLLFKDECLPLLPVAFSPKMEQLIRKILLDYEQTEKVAINNYKEAVVQAMRPLYLKLPKKDRKWFSIENAYDLYFLPCHWWREKKCEQLKSSLYAVKASFAPKIAAEVERLLKLDFENRNTQYQVILSEMKDNPEVKIASNALVHLNQIIFPIIESGKIGKLYEYYYFGRGDVGENGLIYVQSKGIGIDANSITQIE